MRYLTPILLVVLVTAIMVGGSYSSQETAETAIRLIPTDGAQPELVETTLSAYNGIHGVQLSDAKDQLSITYDTSRLSMDDIRHILVSLGYRSKPLEGSKVRAGM